MVKHSKMSKLSKATKGPLNELEATMNVVILRLLSD